MSTRATITVKMNDGNNVSFYKHHDGYVKGGLGEALMNFISVADLEKEPFTKYNFLNFVNESDVVNPTGFEEIEIIKNEYWNNGEEFKSHGDTEYHYTIMRAKENGSIFLFVQKRDYNNGAQNGADKTETGHWTDFAEKGLIGLSGLLFDHKIA